MSTHAPDLFAFFNEIGIINQLATTQLERVLPDGLKVSHFSVLNHLVRLGDDKTPVQLAGAFQVTKGAMTNTLGKLEAKSLVRIRTNPEDGRSKLVALTPKGRKTREAAIKAMAPLFADFAQNLPMGKIEKALPTLQEVRAVMDKARD